MNPQWVIGAATFPIIFTQLLRRLAACLAGLSYLFIIAQPRPNVNKQTLAVSKIATNLQHYFGILLIDIRFIIGYNGYMTQKDTRKNLKVERTVHEKLFILAHKNMTSITKYLTRLIEAEWTTYQIETNGGHDDRQSDTQS